MDLGYCTRVLTDVSVVLVHLNRHMFTQSESDCRCLNIKYYSLRRCTPPILKLPLGWAPSVVNSEQCPCYTHTIHSPLVRGINCAGMPMCGEREREMRMTSDYWLYLLCGHWACEAGMGRFSEEGRGLSFSLIGGSDIEAMTKEW